MTLSDGVHCSTIACAGHSNHVAAFHLWEKITNIYFQVPVLTSALFMPVLGPVLGGNHLPLEDAPAHLVDCALPLLSSADFAP